MVLGKHRAEDQLVRKSHIQPGYIEKCGYLPGRPIMTTVDLNKVQNIVDLNERYAMQNRMHPDSLKKYQLLDETTTVRVFAGSIVVGFIFAYMYNNLRS